MPAIMLSNYIEAAGALPTATFVDVSQIKEYELDFTEHWIFSKGTSASLIGLKTGAVLADVGSAKTIGANHVQLGTALGSRYETAIADGLAWTAFAVVEVPATGAHSSLGAHWVSSSQGTGSGGAMCAVNGATSLDAVSRAVISGASSQQAWNAANLVVGDKKFVAFAIDHSGSNRRRTTSFGASWQDFTDGAAFTPAPSNKIGIGPTASDAAGTVPALKVYEFGVLSGTALTGAQLVKVFERSKARLARQSSLTVV